MFYDLLKKLKEAALGVLPVTLLIIAANSFLIRKYSTLPMTEFDFHSFIIGAVLLVLGLALYDFGSHSSVEFMGGLIGAEISKTRKLPLILGVCGAIGVLVTVAEPDLSVLAAQVNGINSTVLIVSVAAGVGVFMVFAVLRLVLKIGLKWLLCAFYGVIFVLTLFLPREFIPLAFDASGVTTGPVTVPFIIALGASLSVALGGNKSQDSSFGIVGICSIGPVFAVLVLSVFHRPDVAVETGESFNSVSEVISAYGAGLPKFLREMAISLAPILAFFIIYNFAAFKLSRERLWKTFVGLVYVYIGLTLFLLGANIGFLPAGRNIGMAVGKNDPLLLLILGALTGGVTVLAEPAVHVLTEQVEEVTGGVVKRRIMLLVMCVSMAISVGLAMLRIVFDIDLKIILYAGYGLALVLTFAVPDIFTGIAFDSGGVASGAMTAAFLLPMACGATLAVYGADDPNIGGYIMTDAFGVVALVAMTPLVAIQLTGLAYRFKAVKAERELSARRRALLETEGEVIDISAFGNSYQKLKEISSIYEKSEKRGG